MDGEIVAGPANVQGKTPLGVPESSGNVWTVYRLGGGWEVGGGAARPARASGSTDANTGRDAELHRVGTRPSPTCSAKYEVRLNVNNLTDKTYYIGGYNNSPNRVLPGVPLGASVTLRYTFST